MKKKAFKAAFPYTLPICAGFLFLGMCDESFTVNCTVDPPEGVDRGWFMFWVNALNQFYWVTGATAGAILGYVIHFNTTGIEFVMTALVVVMFINQWEEAEDHKPALVVLGTMTTRFLPFIIFPEGKKPPAGKTGGILCVEIEGL